MKSFEQNLEVLMKFLEEGSNSFDKKLIREMQIEFEEGATCPLAQPHKDFIKILMVNEEFPESVRAWAEGVHAYEIALLRPSWDAKSQNQAATSKPVSQPALETRDGIETAMAGEVSAPPDEPKMAVKINVADWNSDL